MNLRLLQAHITKIETNYLVTTLAKHLSYYADSPGKGSPDCEPKGPVPPIQMDIVHKVALVVGGTSGIGLATASRLLRACARHVGITGPNSREGKKAEALLNNSHGKGKAAYFHSNVNCMATFEEAFKSTWSKYKRIDIVVNAAGICDGAHWEKEIVTNVVGTIRGTILASKYAGKEGEKNGGVLINISGLYGVKAFPEAPTLSASHHAIVGLSRSFGGKLHLQKTGLRVVCLCPGFTQSNFIKNIEKKGMTEDIGRELDAAVKKGQKQNPESCGRANVYLIKYAKSGTVWLCKGSKLYSLKIPDPSTYSKLVEQYM